MIIPLRVDRQWMHPDVVRRLRLRERITIAAEPVATDDLEPRSRPRFYGGDYGELPWGLSSEPTEEFFVSEVGHSDAHVLSRAPDWPVTRV